MDEKQQQFLMIVQTMFLANAINIRLDDAEGKKRSNYSASAAFTIMDEAIRACRRIPIDMSASQAANEFSTFMISSAEKNPKCPQWIKNT